MQKSSCSPCVYARALRPALKLNRSPNRAEFSRSVQNFDSVRLIDRMLEQLF